MTKRPSLSGSLSGNMKALAENTSPDLAALAAKSPKTAARVPAASRAGMKKLLTPIPPEMHKRLKILAVERDTTLEEIVRAALTQYLAQQGGH